MSEEPNYVWKGYRQYAEWPVGYVYFATFARECDARDVFKVGWSQNPWHRIRGISYDCGAPVRLIETIEIRRGNKWWGTSYNSLEYLIHDRLAAKRVHPWSLEPMHRSEWYALPVCDVPRIAAQFRQLISEEAA